MSELESFVELKYFPMVATMEYVESIPPPVQMKIVDAWSAPGMGYFNQRTLFLVRLYSSLPHSSSAIIFHNTLRKYLIEYYESQ